MARLLAGVGHLTDRMATAGGQTVLVVCPTSGAQTAACFKSSGCKGASKPRCSSMRDMRWPTQRAHHLTVLECDNVELAVSLLKHQPVEVVVADVRSANAAAGQVHTDASRSQAPADIAEGWHMLDAASYAPLAGEQVARSTSPLRNAARMRHA